LGSRRVEKDYFSDVPSPRINKDMVNLASHILATKQMKFDPRKFKDEYEKALKKLVRRKAKGHAIEEAPPPERTDNVINLMDALGQSLGRRGAKSARKKRPARLHRRVFGVTETLPSRARSRPVHHSSSAMPGCSRPFTGCRGGPMR
jgi:DNA end-binding protein Ku